MRVRRRTLGGRIGPNTNDIGATCDLLEITVDGNTYYYLIDCGFDTSADETASWKPPVEFSALAEFPKIDAMFLTHAHRDHVAGVCMRELTSRLKDDAKVYMTKPTAAFLPYVLFDQLAVSGKRGEKLPYGTLDIIKFRNKVAPIEKPQVLELVPGAIDVLFWPCGHIRGSCSLIFLIQEGNQKIKVMHSSDYTAHDQLTVLGAPMPPPDWLPDIIMSFDCTNGAQRLKSWQEEIERMANDGHNTVKQGGWAFYFAFAMDRSQTFAKKLFDLGLPVWLDGTSAMNFTKIIQSADGSWCDQDMPVKNLEGVKICKYIGEALDNEPAAVVSTSGMGHGPAVEYLLELLPRKDALIGASGYVAPGTNGHRIVNAKRGGTVKIEVEKREFVEVPVNARVEHYRATSHSLRRFGSRRAVDLLRNSQFKNPPIVLSHGSSEAFNWFKSELKLTSGLKVFRSDKITDRDLVLYE